jgi:DNA-binding PadR family transcriptional regulator
MSPLQVAILEIIEANDGKFSWYQLDRALTHRAGADPGIVSRDLMPALRELERAGFITASAGHSPAQPLYSVTPTGQKQLGAVNPGHSEVGTAKPGQPAGTH